MGRNPARLSQKQVDTLEWIKGGSPSSGTSNDIGRRIVARSLERRGLVKIEGHGATWSAAITTAGLAWHEAHPEPKSGDTGVDDLIGRVVAADGRLEIPAGRDDFLAHKELVRLSDHSPNRPRGWRLQLRSSGPWADRREEVVLVRHFEDLVEATPVPIPGNVTRYHPTVKAFLADRDWQSISKEHLGRAARILQAIVNEAPRRGLDILTVEGAKSGMDPHAARALDRCRLAIRTPEGAYGIRIQELSKRSDKRVEPRRWGQRRTRPEWLEARHTEFVSTGNLELRVYGPGASYDGDRYPDAKTISVEDRLPRLFRALEIYRLQAEWRMLEREREAGHQRSRWEAAMALARERYEEQVRWQTFEQRSRDWQALIRHREFLVALREAASTYRGPGRDVIVAHLDFAESRLDGLDPTIHLELVLPAIPDPKPEDLKPFLEGWSPHGPDSPGW